MLNTLTLFQKSQEVNVQNGPGVTIEQKNVSITVYSEELAMPTIFRKFSFTATQGQTVFTLASLPITMIALYINGTGQDEALGDFTISAKHIVLSEGVDAGDHVFGVYQEVGQ